MFKVGPPGQRVADRPGVGLQLTAKLACPSTSWQIHLRQCTQSFNFAIPVWAHVYFDYRLGNVAGRHFTVCVFCGDSINTRLYV